MGDVIKLDNYKYKRAVNKLNDSLAELAEVQQWSKEEAEKKLEEQRKKDNESVKRSYRLTPKK